MLELTISIRNKVGLHARPASLFVKTARGFKSRITLSKDREVVDAKSILGVLTLGAAHGTMVTIRAEGEDEGQAVEKLQELIEINFGEPE